MSAPHDALAQIGVNEDCFLSILCKGFGKLIGYAALTFVRRTAGHADNPDISPENSMFVRSVLNASLVRKSCFSIFNSMLCIFLLLFYIYDFDGLVRFHPGLIVFLFLL